MKLEELGAESGWLIIDKPLNMSSAQAVGMVKRIFRPKKIGHGGTLDPLASGVLPLAFNEATKAFQFVAANRKIYRFTATWGEERSTDDLEGEVVAHSEARPTPGEVEAALAAFRGTIMQAPPAFSAIKVDGKRAYALARSGEAVELPARPVEIYRFDMLETTPHTATFEVECGKGTYIRSLARDMGRKLGCFAHVSFLRRVAVGQFHEKYAISLEKLSDLVHSDGAKEWLLPISSVLADIPALELDSEAICRLQQGQRILLSDEQLAGVSEQNGSENSFLLRIHSQDRLHAIVECDGRKLQTVRLFHQGA